MHFLRRFPRSIPLFAGSLALVVSLSACSTSPSTSPSTDALRSATTLNTTPNLTPGAGDVSTTSVVSGVVQTQVDSSIIKTPPEALAPAPVLANDYAESPKGESITLQATTDKVRVYASATSTEVIQTLDNPLPSGTPLTLLVDGQTSTRYKVLLPVRPNGSTGWINPVDVGIKRTHKFHIEIGLSAYTIKVFNGEDLVMSEKIGVGTQDTPTPNGRYYIKELLQPPKPDGIYGPFAYGLSGFSPVLQSFNGGDGTIGIHGTNKPELLGTRASHGCIRMRNEAISALTKYLPLGTPVIIQA
jgi:lipoprotein-anchoring transpeptidase ErfK/SrfK